MSEVKLKKGESVDKALKRLKRKLDREGTLREARARRNYESPAERARRKKRERRLNTWGYFSLNSKTPTTI
ncbi:MAG: 30S ribosomal protein S21 [Methylacidiphilales bacterium]|nr:30S ribosomal protein S21 [Candidatus Methylacidiphilales bacterium]MDW8349956.1 30S ribosomal protein S21 [Verrucomicrobiae bacterium]